MGSSGLLLRVSGTLWGVSCWRFGFCLGSLGSVLVALGLLLALWGVSCWPFGLCLGYFGSVLVALGLFLGALGFVLGATWSCWVSLGVFCGSVQGRFGHFVAASGWNWLFLGVFNCLWAALGPFFVGSLLSVSWLCLGLCWFYNVSFENLDKR